MLLTAISFTSLISLAQFTTGELEKLLTLPGELAEAFSEAPAVLVESVTGSKQLGDAVRLGMIFAPGPKVFKFPRMAKKGRPPSSFSTALSRNKVSALRLGYGIVAGDYWILVEGVRVKCDLLLTRKNQFYRTCAIVLNKGEKLTKAEKMATTGRTGAELVQLLESNAKKPESRKQEWIETVVWSCSVDGNCKPLPDR